MHEKSAGVVVYHRKGGAVKYLILHYKAGHWDFPKGHIERGESEEVAAEREVTEETGIKNLEFELGFKAGIHYFFRKNRQVISKDVTFFMAGSAAKTVKLSFEHKGHSWLSYTKALNKLTYPTAKDILRKAHAFLKTRMKK